MIGSLLASHTLIALPIVTELGAARLEPIAVTCGATVMSDTLSLVVFAVCVSTYERGFSTSVLVVQLAEITAFALFVLLVLSRLARYALKNLENREDSYFIMLFGIQRGILKIRIVVALLASNDLSKGTVSDAPGRNHTRDPSRTIRLKEKNDASKKPTRSFPDVT